MYCDFYALRAKPFNLTPDPDFLYLSRGHKEALAHLSYGVESKSGFVMVTGEVGSGKTTLLRTLVRNLGRHVCLSQVTNTRVTYKELLELILEDFGVPPRGMTKTGLLTALNDFLVDQFAERKNCVVVVDEAQNLSTPTLEGLRMLSNLETEKAKLLHIILAGQPGLRNLIDSRQLDQLRQRITVRYHLGPMGAGEVGEYVRHRVQKVASDPERAPVFPDEVIPLIYGASGGVPRLINVLCDAALLHGYVAETRVIGAEIVEEVAAQVTRDQQGARWPEAEEALGARGIEERLAQLESQVSALLAGGVPAAPGGGAREDGYGGRLEDLEKREALLEDRRERLREEWGRRMAHLGELRTAAAAGRLMLPPLKVHLWDPDPRLQDAVAAHLSEAGIDTDTHKDCAGVTGALQQDPAGGSFPLVVLGGGLDEGENVALVAGVRERFAHAPIIFLGDIDLAVVRRRILLSGADYFLEKPNDRSRSPATRQGAEEALKGDLLQIIRHIRRQHEAVLDWVGGSRG